MAITLQEAKVGMADKVDQKVIEIFQRSSLLLDALVFDNAIAPGTSGSTMTYGYVQEKSPSTAGVRKINEEYTAGEAKREEKTAKAIIMGGKVNLDRVIIGTSGAVNELAYQIEQKAKATSNYFHNLVINGNSATSGTGVINTFDGLNKMLTGTDTEILSTADVSTSALMDSNYNTLLDEVDAFLSTLDGKPSMLLMNNKLLTKMRNAARRAGYYERTKNDFGNYVETYNGIPMMDAGKYYNGTATLDTIETSKPSASAYGTTDLYAISIGLDGFHGISPTGSKVITPYLPDLTTPGAVKDGEVELIAGVVLKNSKKAGVLRGIKILPKIA
ncbi:MAG: phage capsid protein [Bacilli bacterium]